MNPPSRQPLDYEAVDSLLNRPIDQRKREYKYRCAQAIVFGLPVVALQIFGPALGGAEAERWIGILQALLAGWVVYVGAAGMLFEGLLTIRRSFRADLIIAIAAIGLYLASLVSVLHVLVDGRLWFKSLFFDICVVMLAIWCGMQWRKLSRAQASK